MASQDITKIAQTSFSGGIMSPDMYGRSDDPKFLTGLRQCENFICLPTGPVENRAGFEFVCEVKDSSKAVRLIPFVFSSDQTLVIELGHKYARFHSQGQTLMNGSVPYEIVTPYDADDIFDIRYAQKDDVITLVHGNYAPRELKRYSNLDWRLESINFNDALSAPTGVSATKATAADDEVNVNNYTFSYVVTALDENRLRESQPSAVVSCTANIYNIGTTIRIGWSAVNGAQYYRVYRAVGGIYSYIGETDANVMIDDNIDPDSSITPPRYDDVFSRVNGISAVNVTDGGSGYVYKKKQLITQTFAKPIDFGTGPGRQVLECLLVDPSGSGASIELIYSSTFVRRQKVQHGDIGEVTYVDYYATSATGIRVTNGGQNYESPYLKIRPVFSGSEIWRKNWEKEWNWTNGTKLKKTSTLKTVDNVPVLTVRDSTGTGAVLQPVVTNGAITSVIVKNGGQNYTSPTVTVSGGSGSRATMTATVASVEDYPNAVNYYEQRRVFANMHEHPQQIIMTKTGTESTMMYSVPVKSDDRIKFEFASNERNTIEHLVSLSRLIALTESAEWVVTALNSDAITPTSVSAKAQSYVGASKVRPVVVNNRIVYGARRGGHMRVMNYDFNSNGFSSGDLSLRATDLFDRKTIVDMCFVKAPQPIVWCISSDGSLLGMTFLPDQEVAAWHKHTTLNGVFESCCSVAEGDDDILYVVVNRYIGGSRKRYIERMRSRSFNSVSEAFFVDSGYSYFGEATTSVTGLDWLEGETVSILADGAEELQQVVTDGMVSVPVAATRIQVGLPITATLELLPIHSARSATGFMGEKKNVNMVTLRLRESSGIFVGPSEEQLVEFKQRTTESMGQPPELVTGDVQILLKPNWSLNATVLVRQTSPLPLTLVSLMAEVSHSG